MKIIDTNLKFRNVLPHNNSPKNIVLHHTECNGWSVDRLHQLHKNEFGWNGIGYHFYIRKDGRIYRGRPESTMGSHCKGFNRNSLGIAFEGDYQNTDKIMPQAQLNSALWLVGVLKNKYGNMGIYGHREVGSSNCPGRYFPLNNFKNSTIHVQNSGGSVEGRYGIVTASVLNVRETNSIDSKIIRQLKEGTKIKIYKQYGNWYSIYPTGCVYGKYIRLL
ncbi:N-acetylmuramoyl-L-alanine amidase [Clostridium sp. MB40-C1]|uniref:N-acetylmuramoyl-L-alanine amidase n=1 Tax=Clostridium sp. MB40-C1 TaxID=3070996 RepID=UPI0027E10935|nr:N-acetylmuramoyl-L-alanine amidase [Clostridium sp. MB40-C1]WMJ81985.1 N-acetylmuramoyl-L-alanine amidase [Clostridium sp. MB40-C1]